MTSDEIRRAANLVFKDGKPKFPDEAQAIWWLSEIAAQLAELNENYRQGTCCSAHKSPKKDFL